MESSDCRSRRKRKGSPYILRRIFLIGLSQDRTSRERKSSCDHRTFFSSMILSSFCFSSYSFCFSSYSTLSIRLLARLSLFQENAIRNSEHLRATGKVVRITASNPCFQSVAPELQYLNLFFSSVVTAIRHPVVPRVAC